MNNRKFAGTVLWWSERDGNGIITDANDNEWYFDGSVVNVADMGSSTHGKQVTFEHNELIEDCLCACKVKII